MRLKVSIVFGYLLALSDMQFNVIPEMLNIKDRLQLVLIRFFVNHKTEVVVPRHSCFEIPVSLSLT